MKKINFIENEALDKKFNTKLFNEIVNFVITTTDIDSYNAINQISEKFVWFKKEVEDNIQDKYEIEYLGELLERFEEKIGANIENLRAIAIAIGCIKDLINGNMIIGTQLIDFIAKIKEKAENDIYLKGALLLYDKNKFETYINELIKIDYKNTEDIIFIFSLFEEKADIFEKLKPKLIELLGKRRTISPINNIKTYAWVINNIYKLINTKRRKDIELLKALCVIPTKLLKEESNEYKILIENSYNKEEIAYLNYAILFYSSIPKTVRLGNSIVEEKIVTKFCKTIINDDKEYNLSMYELIKELIEKYRVFDIKYAKNQNLKETLLKYEKINIVNPITFMNFYDIFNQNIFAFNILDKKWDILAKNMNIENYRKLFDNYIQYGNIEKNTLQRCISKYEELTQISYIDSFLNYDFRRENLFKKLVDNNIISLIKFYESIEDNMENDYLDLEHLKRYVNRIDSKKSFLFLQYIIEEKNYPINKIEKFEFNLKDLYKNNRYGGGFDSELDFKKQFLNLEERKKLLLWLDNYMFKMYPSDYIRFVIAYLKSDDVLELVSKKKLREVYFLLIENENEILENKELRKIYLTQEELQKIENKEQEEKEKKIRQELLERQEKILNQFNNIPKSRFKELKNFCDTYKWIEEEWNICSNIVKHYIKNNIQKFLVDDEQSIELMKLLTLLMAKNVITINEVKQYVIDYLKEGDTSDGKFIRAC